MDKSGKALNIKLTEGRDGFPAIEDTPALRDELYRRDVVVFEDLNELNGIAVIWADKHYGKRLEFIVLMSVLIVSGLLFAAFTIGMANSQAASGLAWLPAILSLGSFGAVIRFSFKNGNARRYDTLRCLTIRTDGRLAVPFGVPNGEAIRWLRATYEDVTGIQLSPEREWGGYSGSDKFCILLQTESGKPVFLGLSDRSKAELQPVIVALHNAWEKMRPFVTANRAIAAGLPIVVGDAP